MRLRLLRQTLWRRVLCMPVQLQHAHSLTTASSHDSWITPPTLFHPRDTPVLHQGRCINNMQTYNSPRAHVRQYLTFFMMDSRSQCSAERLQVDWFSTTTCGLGIFRTVVHALLMYKYARSVQIGFRLSNSKQWKLPPFDVVTQMELTVLYVGRSWERSVAGLAAQPALT